MLVARQLDGIYEGQRDQNGPDEAGLWDHDPPGLGDSLTSANWTRFLTHTAPKGSMVTIATALLRPPYLSELAGIPTQQTVVMRYGIGEAPGKISGQSKLSLA